MSVRWLSPLELDAIEQGRHDGTVYPEAGANHPNPEIPVLRAGHAVTEAPNLVVGHAWKERADGDEVVPEDVEELLLGRRNGKVVSLGLTADALARMPAQGVGAHDAPLTCVQGRKRFEMVGEPDIVGIEERDQRCIDLSDRRAPRCRRPGISLEGDDGHGQQPLPPTGEGGGLVARVVVAHRHGHRGMRLRRH